MLDFNAALELMAKYGYSSSTSHPYIYEAGDSIGMCYLYNDEDFGTLERVKIFDSLESFEDFLKQLDWVKKNGLLYHVRMALDNYETMNPKPIFLRNEKVMVEGEMYDIDNFDLRESQRNMMDDASKVVFEAGDLLLIYDEIKNRQVQYFSSLVSLKNQLREKYFELQKEIDIYNKVKVDRNLTLLPDVPDSGGIDEMLEIAIKDRYNVYVSQRPSFEEALQFLKEVWDLNYKIESNIRYYDAIKEENEIRNELKVVAQKMEYMQKLNEDLRPLFGVDLVSKFRRINKVCKETSTSISDESIKAKLKLIEKKYSFYNQLDYMYASDYLREAIQNTNYDDLAMKYSKGVTFEVANKARTPMHDVAASLSVQYRDKLSVEEQAILVLYNNEKFRAICNAILSVENFDLVPLKQVMKAVSGVKGLSKIKTECYAAVKTRIEDPVNATIKASLFKEFDFTSFDTFVGSLVKGLARLKTVDNKMVLNGDINMYLMVKKTDDVLNKKYLNVTNDLNTLLHDKGRNMIGITLLKEKLPVLYSPYYLDIGDIYSKNPSLQMYIKEMVNFELLVEKNDVNVNLDEVTVDVVKYGSDPIVEGNVYIVKELKALDKTTFVKFAISSKITGQAQPVAAAAVETPVPESEQAVAPVVPEAVQTEVQEPPVAPVNEVQQPIAVPEAPVAEPPVAPVVAPVVAEAPAEPPALPVQENVPAPEPVIEEKSEDKVEEAKAPETELTNPFAEVELKPAEIPKVEEPKKEEPEEPVQPPIVEEKLEEVLNVEEEKKEEPKEEPKPEVKPPLENKVEEKTPIEEKEKEPVPPKPEEKKEETPKVEEKPIIEEKTKEEIVDKDEEEEISNRLDEFLSSVSNISNTIYKDSVSRQKPPAEAKPEEKKVEAPKTAPIAKPAQPPKVEEAKKEEAPKETKPVAAKPATAIKPVAPAAKPATSATKPVAPTAKPVAPVAQPAPAPAPAAPAAKPVASTAKPTEAVKPTATVAKPVAPATTAAKPAASDAKPAAPIAKPAAPAAKSVASVAKPATAAAKPTTTVKKTTPTSTQPAKPTTVSTTPAQKASTAANPAAPTASQPVKKVVVAKNISKPVTQEKKEGE